MQILTSPNRKDTASAAHEIVMTVGDLQLVYNLQHLVGESFPE